MKIQPNYNEKSISFSGKRPNDSTYWVIKNPETASDAMERGFVDDFLKRNPNWEKDEKLVHRLKQDTIKARAKGKIRSQWHEFDTAPWLDILFEALVTAVSVPFLTKKNFSKLNKFSKIIFTFGAVAGPLMIINDLKYILTGRNLFEKKENSSASKK